LILVLNYFLQELYAGMELII